MADLIPFATTTVDIMRPSGGVDIDPGDTVPTWSQIGSGIPGTITVPADVTSLIAGESTTTNARLYTNPGVDIQPDDEVIDRNGDTWTVIRTLHIYPLIPSIMSSLRLKTGVTSQ